MIPDHALTTERLMIRPFEPTDVPILVSIFADPAVARFVGDGGPMSVDDAKRWVANSRANLGQFGYGTGAVVARLDQSVIGWAGFARPIGQPEQIVYGLVPRYWHQGYGGEIVKALVDFSDERGFDPCWATVDPANIHSVRLLVKYGFHLHTRSYLGEVDSDLYRRTWEDNRPPWSSTNP